MVQMHSTCTQYMVYVHSTCTVQTSTVPAVLLIDVSLFNPLVLGSPVLEPDLDLGLTQPQTLSQLTPSQ